MKFGRVATATGEGLILAHAVRAPGVDLRKGEVVGAGDVLALKRAGVPTLIGARLEDGDVDENAAALRLGRHVAGANVRPERAFTGRCNLHADIGGLLCIDVTAVDAINAIDESITLATLPPSATVTAGELIATVKIIPFAVGGGNLARGTAVAQGAVRVAPFLPLRVGVVSTLLPALKPSTVAKTLGVLEGRLEPTGATLAREVRVAHDARALAAALHDLLHLDLLVIFGASAITDRRDVVPDAIERAGGAVDHLGMPVDPGNLLLLGHLHRDGARVQVIGAPGCARSPKENGFDLVLRRLLAGLTVTGADLRRMGVGGLLSEIITRPQPRQPADG